MAVSGVMLGASEDFTTALVARIIGGVGATIVALVATKMTTDWFDSREIVLAMSILQVSWPFGAMLALPIQAYIALLWGWPAVMISGALCAGAALCAFAFVSEPSEQKQRTVVVRSMLRGGVLVPVVIAGTVFGAMNLACVFFFMLGAGVGVGAGFVAYRRRIADQPRHLVHDPGHSIGRIPGSPLGQANRSHCRLLADCCRGTCAVCRRGPSDNLLHDIRSFCRSIVRSDPFASVDGARPARSGGRIWRVLYVLLFLDGCRA